jgi:hypothetical protein
VYRCHRRENALPWPPFFDWISCSSRSGQGNAGESGFGGQPFSGTVANSQSQLTGLVAGEKDLSLTDLDFSASGPTLLPGETNEFAERW